MTVDYADKTLQDLLEGDKQNDILNKLLANYEY